MTKLLELPLRIFLMITGIIFVFALPSLIGIRKSLIFTLDSFWEYVESTFSKLTQTDYLYIVTLLDQMNIAESYRYSMTIVFISLLLVISFGMVTAILIQNAPKKLRNTFKKVINFFEGVPDLLIIFLFQFFVITLYQSTGIKFLQLYGIFGQKPYFVPIITISCLPVLFLIQFLIKVLEEEEVKDYVLYLKAKGLSQFNILVVHMLRNIFPLFIIQLRTSIWIILSNIYLLEYMFNIQGFTKTFQSATESGEFLVLIICLLLFTLPLLIMEAVSYIVLKFFKGKESTSL
jgi:peptide/nickel transport system permease protein